MLRAKPTAREGKRQLHASKSKGKQREARASGKREARASIRNCESLVTGVFFLANPASVFVLDY
jgi:hypothetical protein